MRSFLYYTESNGYKFPGRVGGGCREQEPVSYGSGRRAAFRMERAAS